MLTISFSKGSFYLNWVTVLSSYVLCGKISMGNDSDR